ncbi:MAG: hypothetical protein ACE5IO_02800 [Thermoplasmata archaeon]
MTVVEFTTHARDMLQERGFEEDTIVSIVVNPDWKEPGEGDLW